MTPHPRPFLLCRTCGVRYRQLGALCVRCFKAAGGTRTPTRTYEAARVAAEEARLAALPRAQPAPTPTHTRTINGVEYAVVFDGRQSLLDGRGREQRYRIWLDRAI